jgi:hypothetical protein
MKRLLFPAGGFAQKTDRTNAERLRAIEPVQGALAVPDRPLLVGKAW